MNGPTELPPQVPPEEFTKRMADLRARLWRRRVVDEPWLQLVDEPRAPVDDNSGGKNV